MTFLSLDDLLKELESERKRRPVLVKAYQGAASFIKRSWYGTISGVRGLAYWAKFAWSWRSWDWVYGVDALVHHLKAVERAIERGQVDERHKRKRLRNIRTTIALLGRVSEDRYYAGSPAECLSTETDLKRRSYQQQKDLEMALDIIKKDLLRWWD